MLLNVLLPQRPDHRSVGEARVNDGAADSVVNGLLTQGCRSAFEGGLGGGVGDLAGDARRRDRADEDDRPLDPFRGLPSAHAVGFAVLGDPGDQFHRPVHRRNEVDLQDLPEVPDRIELGLASLFVHLDGKLVTRDAGRGHADRRGTVLGAHQVKRLAPELLVGRVANHGFGERGLHPIIDHPGNPENVFRAVNKRDCPGASLGKFEGNRLPDAAGGACHDRTFPLNVHQIRRGGNPRLQPWGGAASSKC